MSFTLWHFPVLRPRWRHLGSSKEEWDLTSFMWRDEGWGGGSGGVQSSLGITAKALHKGIVCRFVSWEKAGDFEEDYR